MRTGLLGAHTFRNRTQTFLAGSHIQNTFRENDAFLGIAFARLEFGACALPTDTSQNHEHEAKSAQTKDGLCQFNLAKMLVARALVASRTPNRVVDETQARIGHAFQLGHATIVCARILYLHNS